MPLQRTEPSQKKGARHYSVTAIYVGVDSNVFKIVSFDWASQAASHLQAVLVKMARCMLQRKFCNRMWTMSKPSVHYGITLFLCVLSSNFHSDALDYFGLSVMSLLFCECSRVKLSGAIYFMNDLFLCKWVQLLYQKCR